MSSSYLPGPGSGRTPRAPRTSVWTALIVMGALLGLMWGLEAVDQATGNSLDPYGIRPRSQDGLLGIVVAPVLHFGWPHLISNSLPFLLLGTLILVGGWSHWIGATGLSVLFSGVLVWLFAPTYSVTIGASGVVFGWLTYLLVRGFYSRSPAQLLLGVVLFLVYGGILWGVLPTDSGVSWQGHLGGAIGGAIAARMLHRREPADRARGRSPRPSLG